LFAALTLRRAQTCASCASALRQRETERPLLSCVDNQVVCLFEALFMMVNLFGRGRAVRAFLVLFASALLAASAHSQLDRTTAEKLLEQSGTLAQIDALPPQFRANFEQALREQRDLPITSDEVRKFAEMGDSAFAATKLHASVTETVAKRLSATDASAVRDWYMSPTGLKMLALEAAAASADHASAVKRGRGLLERMPKEQSAQLRALLNASRAAEFVASLSINMAVSAAFASATATSLKEVPTYATLRESAIRDREQLTQSIAEVMIAVYANTYDRASDAETKQYLAFLRSSAGKTFSDAILRAFDNGITASATELATALVDSKRPPPRRR
jgi:hypothetical protein